MEENEKIILKNWDKIDKGSKIRLKTLEEKYSKIRNREINPEIINKIKNI